MSKAEELSSFDFARLADVRALKPGLLYPYQSDGVAFLLSKKRRCWVTTGSGEDPPSHRLGADGGARGQNPRRVPRFFPNRHLHFSAQVVLVQQLSLIQRPDVPIPARYPG
jgi:hypothetical protein